MELAKNNLWAGGRGASRHENNKNGIRSANVYFRQMNMNIEQCFLNVVIQ